MTFEAARTEVEKLLQGTAGFIGTGRGGVPGRETVIVYLGPAWEETRYPVPPEIDGIRVEVRHVSDIRPR